MKRILFLSFYFEPDLCAGSFRNTPLAEKLSEDAYVHVITTMPNRYSSYKASAEVSEVRGNLRIDRIELPSHQSGMKDQSKAFIQYANSVKSLSKEHEYDLVYASSSRLFTAFLGSYISRQKKIPLFLDIRDIFKETISDVLGNKFLTPFVGGVIGKIEKYTFRKASVINIVSEGFRDYLEKICGNEMEIVFHPNGIDDLFMEPYQSKDSKQDRMTIIYAGNIGGSQGLEKTLPKAASSLGEHFLFRIIGDGGTKNLLEREIKRLGVNNIVIEKPVPRKQLPGLYSEADVLFVQLNDLPAFERVLPSKIFEYGATSKPIVGLLGEESAKLLRNNAEGAFINKPGQVDWLIDILKSIEKKQYDRSEFRMKYSREQITRNLALKILETIGS